MSAGSFPAADPFRVYLDPAEIAPPTHPDAGYPWAWFKQVTTDLGGGLTHTTIPIKHLIRERDGHRCLRCGHPYTKGDGQWSACDERCTHLGPLRLGPGGPTYVDLPGPWKENAGEMYAAGLLVDAQWRILTVHHLNGIKHDCRWWNLVSLCQRCHLTIQAKVFMDRPWHKPHSEWFRPFAAAFYAWKYLDVELTREEVDARLDELLLLERSQDPLF